MSDRPVEIRRLVTGEVERLRPLWLGLRSHHEAVSPQLPAHVPDDDSWARRRALYETWLAEPDAFVLVAEIAGEDEPAGYALVSVDGPDDTWETGGRRAELQTLAVAPHARGDGVGSRLMDAVGAELDRLGLPGLFVAVVATNTDAIRFYERRAVVPCLVSFYGRPVLPEPEPERELVPVTVRDATPSDCDAIARLLGHLGFPTSPDEARRRLARLGSDARSDVIVAEAADAAAVVGIAAMCVIDLLERERPSCRLTALVTDPAVRGRGVAGALVAEVEARARTSGCFRVEVTSGDDLHHAHAFYRRAGFAQRSRRFVKTL